MVTVIENAELVRASAERVNRWLDGGCSSWGVPDSDIKKLAAALEATASPKAVVTDAWQDMASAPKDGTMLKLLVRPGSAEEDGWTPFADSSDPYQTIGFNALSDTMEDEWQFAGWDWIHDCFTDGAGEVIGWQPLSAALPLTASPASPALRDAAKAILAHKPDYADTLWENLEEALAEPKEWRCYHCDEVFTDDRAAQEHFGFEQCSDPACRIKLGAERSLVTALRRAEKDAADAWNAIHNETTDSAKAYHAQAARHQEQLRVVEEEGYERGLADGQALTASPARGEVAVKALTWCVFCSNSGNRSAQSVCGEYIIQRYEELWVLHLPHEHMFSGNGYDTPDEAEAAAQADFDQRIRSALASAEPVPATGGE